MTSCVVQVSSLPQRSEVAAAAAHCVLFTILFLLVGVSPVFLCMISSRRCRWRPRELVCEPRITALRGVGLLLIALSQGARLMRYFSVSKLCVQHRRLIVSAVSSCGRFLPEHFFGRLPSSTVSRCAPSEMPSRGGIYLTSLLLFVLVSHSLLSPIALLECLCCSCGVTFFDIMSAEFSAEGTRWT